jgi:hypothetical protein
MTKEEINQAFTETNYYVLISNGKSITLNVNKKLEELEILFPNLNSWCFITAFNPLPEILELAQNKKRNQELEHDILNLGFEYLDGIGLSADGNWSEESFFIKNISLKSANQLAIKYEQLAFLFGEKRKAATLFYTK